MGDPAVALSRVCKRHGAFALDDVSFRLAPRSVTGLLGVNGSGKSTILRILLGLVRADSGRVEVLGRHMPRAERDVKQDVGFVSEDMALYRNASLAWHARLAKAACRGWDDAYAATLIERFRIDPERDVAGMSRGQSVACLLVLALARRPRLLVMDEPTAGLDPIARLELLAELRALHASSGMTILFSSHNTADVEALCDRVVMIDAGRVLAESPLSELTQGDTLDAAFRAKLHARTRH